MWGMRLAPSPIMVRQRTHSMAAVDIGSRLDRREGGSEAGLVVRRWGLGWVVGWCAAC